VSGGSANGAGVVVLQPLVDALFVEDVVAVSFNERSADEGFEANGAIFAQVGGEGIGVGLYRQMEAAKRIVRMVDGAETLASVAFFGNSTTREERHAKGGTGDDFVDVFFAVKESITAEDFSVPTALGRVSSETVTARHQVTLQL